MALDCPLCQSSSLSHFHRDSKRNYQRCDECALVFVEPAFYLPPALEKAEYDKHENSLHDAGYRAFLQRLADPLCHAIPAASEVLEFGCGPGPALADMLRSAGHRVSLYDPFYYPQDDVLQAQKYDVITATEVIEHLHQPRTEIESWLKYLKPQGWLGIMTKTVIDAQRFASWHYKNDPTHVCFYSHETFDFIAEKYHLTWRAVANDAFIFNR